MLFLKKLQKKELRFKGEITVLLSLTFVLVLSLVGVLIESASIHRTKIQKRVNTVLALESAFAEYDTELLEQYGIFARRGAEESMLQQRLAYYGASNMEHEIKESEILTDGNGTPFYLQAVNYAKEKYGMDGGINIGSGFSSEQNLLEQIDDFLFSEELVFEEGSNPLQALQNLRKLSLLSCVLSSQEDISQKAIEISGASSHRTLQQGIGSIERTSEIKDSDKFFFVQYMEEHFGRYLTVSDERVLDYEWEYLLSGKETDRENLEAVCLDILKLRMITNYTYLLTDTVRKAEAEAMAVGISSLLLNPIGTELIKQGLLIAWAYGESVVDIRVLLKGGKTALIKSNESWQLQLANVMKLGTSEESAGEKSQEVGISYEDYLKGLAILKDRKTLSMRALDLIEEHLKIRADEYMTGVTLSTTMSLRYDIKRQFETSRYYQ